MRIAVIGAGIAGLGCAHALTRFARDARNPNVQVTLYEAAHRLGGHANTVDVELDGRVFPVDTGFLVFNERTYPNLIRLFADLDVPTTLSDMTFAVSVPVRSAFGARRLEWSGANLDTVFAQRRNLASPAFVGMLRDLLRFNTQATRIAAGQEDDGDLTLGEFLQVHRYGSAFRDWYLLPMAAAIWSCPTRAMLDYPFSSFARFFRNHGLLQLADRPQWYTVRGGSRQYVERIARGLADVRLATPVRALRRDRTQAWVNGERFDALVLACHSDQALALLGADASVAERAVLSAIPYQKNRALLHTDATLLPRNRRVWSAWNYTAGVDTPQGRPVSVHYLINKLQPLPFAQPVIVSLNPHREPQATRVLGEFDYEHPVFSAGAAAAQARLPEIQGVRSTWFCGAWTRYGFHEDGFASALEVARALDVEPLRRAA